ncbi:MAG: chromate transporter [Lentisphaerae bacterium]|nr:chromate transporter [Lentisphaerota bacterium]MBR2721027.1 chromate transporter [Lentisphaeria bacterium]
MTVLMLFLTFCKFGLLCFGGGYMLIPLLTAEFVGAGKVLTPERFGNLISISQLTPGPVGINTATFVGYVSANFRGSLAATLGLVFPTLVLAGLAMKFIIKYREHPLMKGILYGARVGAAALVVYAVIIFLELSVVKGSWQSFRGLNDISYGGVLIMATAFILLKKFKWQTTWVIILSGVLGAIIIPLIG